MKRLSYAVPVMALTLTLAFAPAVTAQAHGHHGGHHNESYTNYYYCDGHEAHLHDNDVCPYAQSAQPAPAPEQSNSTNNAAPSDNSSNSGINNANTNGNTNTTNNTNTSSNDRTIKQNAFHQRGCGHFSMRYC